MTENNVHAEHKNHKNIVHTEHDVIPLPPDDEMERASKFLRTLGDSTKFRIVCTLISGEVCAGCISETLGMTKSAISHQLALLKKEGLIKSRRSGKHVIYSLDDDHVHEVLEMTLEHIHHKHESGSESENGNENESESISENDNECMDEEICE